MVSCAGERAWGPCTEISTAGADYTLPSLAFRAWSRVLMLSGRMSVHTLRTYAKHSSFEPVTPAERQFGGIDLLTGQMPYCSSWLISSMKSPEAKAPDDSPFEKDAFIGFQSAARDFGES